MELLLLFFWELIEFFLLLITTKRMWCASLNKYLKWVMTQILAPSSEAPTDIKGSVVAESLVVTKAGTLARPSLLPLSITQTISLEESKDPLHFRKRACLRKHATEMRSSRCSLSPNTPSSSPIHLPQSHGVPGSPSPSPTQQPTSPLGHELQPFLGSHLVITFLGKPALP